MTHLTHSPWLRACPAHHSGRDSCLFWVTRFLSLSPDYRWLTKETDVIPERKGMASGPVFLLFPLSWGVVILISVWLLTLHHRSFLWSILGGFLFHSSVRTWLLHKDAESRKWRGGECPQDCSALPWSRMALWIALVHRVQQSGTVWILAWVSRNLPAASSTLLELWAIVEGNLTTETGYIICKTQCKMKMQGP